MPSFTFEFVTFSPEMVERLSQLERNKRVLLANKYALLAKAPMNSVQMQSLGLIDADDSMRYFLDSLDLETCEEICNNPEVKVFNSRINAIMDSDLDICIKYKDKSFGVF